MVSCPKPEKRKKKGRKKLLPFKSLVKKADRIFSAFIRNRDAVELNGKCCTCGKPGNQCGHYVKRGHLRTRWDVRNCALQCQQCNFYKDGNQDEFAVFLIEKYGWEILNELNYLKSQPFKVTRDFLEEVIKAYS